MMKRTLLLCALAAPLAGCAERAELAPALEKPAGPVTLAYRLNPGDTIRYRTNLEGEGTGGVGNTAEPGDDSRRVVTSRFESEMITEQAVASGDAPSVTAAPETTTPAASAPEDLSASATEPTGNVPDGTTTASESPTTSSPEPQSRFRVNQTVQDWSLKVNLPEKRMPNQFSGHYEAGSLDVRAHGVPFDMPARYRDLVVRTLQQPAVATVTPLGEVLGVDWPVPAALPTESSVGPQMGHRFYTMSSHSVGPLNLWFGMIHLPERPVSVGDTWEGSGRMPVTFTNSAQAAFQLERNARYTLKDLVRTGPETQAVIDVTETLRLVRDTAPAPAPAGTTDVLQTRTGTVHFNVDRGLIDRADQQFDVAWDTWVQSTMTAADTQPKATSGHVKGNLKLERLPAGLTSRTAAPAE